MSKTAAAVYRVKRNVENVTITENITNILTTEKNKIQEQATIAPLVDQVTEAITVTQISGSSPQDPEDITAPLNFQPFTITSSDFKNESQSGNNFDANIDVAELINQKIRDVDPTYKQKQEEVQYKDEDEDEENEEQQEDIDKLKLIIHVDELPKTQDIEDRKLKQKEEDNEEKLQNENIENLNNVDEDADNKNTHKLNSEEENEEYDDKIHNQKTENLNHIKKEENLNHEEGFYDDKEQNQKNVDLNNYVNYNKYFDRENKEDSANNPQKNILVINVPNESAEEKESSHDTLNDNEPIMDKEPIIVMDNFEKHLRTLGRKPYTPKKIEDESETEKEDNIEYAEIPEETQREVEEKEKYFDDIISQQLEANHRLQHELEYPDLDNEYEAYRKKADDQYLGTKTYDFENVGKPYNIQLKGDFPFEKELQDRNYNDDVDEGSDKMRYKNNYEYLDEEDVPEQNAEKQLKANNTDKEEADELTNSAAEEQEDDETDDLKNPDSEDQEENNEEQSTEQKYLYLPLHKQESRINEIAKEREELTTKKPTLSFNGFKNTGQGAMKLNFNQPETVKNVLKSILSKRDAISRQQNEYLPETYNTFWSLLYKNPRS